MVEEKKPERRYFLGNLPKDQVCTNPPKYSWFEIREAINRHIEEREKDDEQREAI